MLVPEEFVDFGLLDSVATDHVLSLLYWRI